MAMDKSNVIEQLKDGVATVRFTKLNGEMREMRATLNENQMPEIVAEIENKAPRKKSENALSVWDVDKQAWRSFRWDRLEKINGVAYNG
jgi:hypothetical protein